MDNLSTYGGHSVEDDEMYQVWIWVDSPVYDVVLKGRAFPLIISYDTLDVYDFIALSNEHPGEYFLLLSSMAKALTYFDCRYVWMGPLITIYNVINFGLTAKEDEWDIDMAILDIMEFNDDFVNSTEVTDVILDEEIGCSDPKSAEDEFQFSFTDVFELWIIYSLCVSISQWDSLRK